MALIKLPLIVISYKRRKNKVKIKIAISFFIYIYREFFGTFDDKVSSCAR